MLGSDDQSSGASLAGDSRVRKLQKELNSGTFSLVLLALLGQADEPMYGYQIAKGLEEKTEEGAGIKHGTLYPVLRALDAQGLLSSEVEPSVAGPPRRYYTITEEGRRVLACWLPVWTRTRDFVDAILAGGPHA